MDPAYEQSLGSLDTVLLAGANRFIAALNERFAAYASTQDNFYLYDLHGAAAGIGLDTWHNRFQYYAYKFTMNYDVLSTVAHGIANIVKAILEKTKKCLVLDLDNTLWGGTLCGGGSMVGYYPTKKTVWSYISMKRWDLTAQRRTRSRRFGHTRWTAIRRETGMSMCREV